LDGDAGKFFHHPPHHKEASMSGESHQCDDGIKQIAVTVSSHPPLVLDSIAGINMRRPLDTWQVQILNQISGRVVCVTVTCDAATLEEVVNHALEALPYDEERDSEGEGHYDVSVTLLHGQRKLWDIHPARQDSQALGLRKPSLIGRVVARDEDEAAQAAMARFKLSDEDFSLCLS
jgi:hypothetical protein